MDLSDVYCDGPEVGGQAGYTGGTDSGGSGGSGGGCFGCCGNGGGGDWVRGRAGLGFTGGVQEVFLGQGVG